MMLFIVALVSCFFQMNSLKSQMSSWLEDTPIFAEGRSMHTAACHPHWTEQSIILSHLHFLFVNPKASWQWKPWNAQIFPKLPIALLMSGASACLRYAGSFQFFCKHWILSMFICLFLCCPLYAPQGSQEVRTFACNCTPTPPHL